MLCHCNTNQDIRIPWYFIDKWLNESMKHHSETQEIRMIQVEDCSSVCDISYEWHTLRRQATRRGPTSAIYPAIQLTGHWRHHQRMALKEHSIEHGSIVDSQMTYCVSCTNLIRQSALNALGSLAENDTDNLYRRSYISRQDLLDIDGVTWSSRFYQLFSQGAVVLKQNSQYKHRGRTALTIHHSYRGSFRGDLSSIKLLTALR